MYRLIIACDVAVLFAHNTLSAGLRDVRGSWNSKWKSIG